MITYENKGLAFFINLFRSKGSVFPKALCLAFPNAVGAFCFVYSMNTGDTLNHFKDKDSVMSNNSIWGGFSFAIGFLVIFRTSQAYSRFWEGCTNMHKMGAEWYEACAALMAFTKHSDKPMYEVMKFQNLLVRLFSMLHASACAEIEESVNVSGHLKSYNMELIDAETLSDESLLAVQNSDAKTEMIMQWIQQVIVLNIKTGILSIPPPILSRSFQEIATGMVHFNEAMKIANVPFPFPYAQTCDMLLLLHWFAVPFIISQWVAKPWWAGVFAFIMVFTMWTLNFIAIELENPFGEDANDIDGHGMQRDMNTHLRTLMKDGTLHTPSLKKESKTEDEELDEQEEYRSRALGDEEECDKSFTEVWKALHHRGSSDDDDSEEFVPVSRFRATVKPGMVAVHSHTDKKKKKDAMGKTKSDLTKVEVHDDSFQLTKRKGSEKATESFGIQSLGIQSMDMTAHRSLEAFACADQPQNGDLFGKQPSEKVDVAQGQSEAQLVEAPLVEAPLVGSDFSLNATIMPDIRSVCLRQDQTVASTPVKADSSSLNANIMPDVRSVCLRQSQTTAGHDLSLNGHAAASTNINGHDRSLNGHAMLENAGHSPVLSVDQGQTMANHSPGYNRSVNSSPGRMSRRSLSSQVPALLPRVLNEKIAVTPRGLGPLPAFNQDALLNMLPPTHRALYANGPPVELPLPTQRASYNDTGPPGDSLPPTQRSLYHAARDVLASPIRSSYNVAGPAAGAMAASHGSNNGAGLPAERIGSIRRSSSAGPSAVASATTPRAADRSAGPPGPQTRVPSRPSQTRIGSFTSCMS